MPKYNDLKGQRVGRLTVLEKGNGRLTSGGMYKTTWICRCDCGKIKEIDYEKLKRKSTLSCGCLRDEKVSKVNFEDLTGQKYNRLTFVRYLEKSERKTRGYNWLCQCECGKLIPANASKVKSGHTRSCGCLEKEFIGNVNKKYLNKDRRLYCVFRSMMNRCNNPKNIRYNSYGGRGIKVCDEWSCELGFDSFYNWSYSNGYEKNLTLDRIDVNGNYEPSNCRWITNQKQQNNRRDNIFIECDGEKLTIAELARKYQIPYSTMSRWVKKKKFNYKQIIEKVASR